jgi:flavin reductase (DIM6/NTAB) family NADH-FMN oxidoreductase RutF
VNDHGDFFEQMALEVNPPATIVTLAVGDRRAGCVVGFATRTSMRPRRFLVCLSHENHTYRLAREADALAVHLVPCAQRGLAELFGGETGDEVDKFDRCAWRPGPRGSPLLCDCPSWFEGVIVSRHDLGDHEGFLLNPIAGRRVPGELLHLHDIGDIRPGHPA